MVREISPGVTADPKILGGRPVIRGTRVPVDLVVGKLGGGMTMEQVMDQYDLEREGVLAALRYAAHLVSIGQTQSAD